MGGDLASSFANVASPATSNSGLGGLLAATQGISSLFSVLGGISKYKAQQQEAAQYNAQADLASQEYQLQVDQQARTVKRFAASQAMQYAGSGVTLEGSPLLVLQDTYNQGQKQVQALADRGNALYNLYTTQGQQTANKGRADLFSGFGDAFKGAMSSYISGRRIGLFGGASSLPNVGATTSGNYPGDFSYIGGM